MTARANQTRIPSYTEVHTTSPTAAGLPVLEVVRRLEEEKLITKDDRIALKDGLYSVDVARREEIVKALCEVELSMNSRFSLRRLKAVIHQNGGGEVSSKSQHQQPPPASNGYINFPTNTSTNNSSQGLKSEPRPSKYRMKPKSSATPEVLLTPLRSNSDNISVPSASTTNTKGSPVQHSQPIPSSSGAHGNNNSSNGLNTMSSAGLRLFSSPAPASASTYTTNNNSNNHSNNSLQVHSAREKSTGPVFTGFNSDTGQTINYTNNNIPMSSPITSRSRGEDGSGSMYNIGRVGSVSNPGSSGVNSSAYINNTTYTTNTSNGNSATTSASGSGVPRHRTSPTRTGNDTNNNTTPNKNYTTNNNNNNNNPDSDDFMENISTIDAINQVVGSQPVYSGPDCFNGVLSKVASRLSDYYAKFDAASRGRRKFAVLVGGGSFNPLTRMHLRTYFLAKQCLEAKYGYVVLGSLLSPAHGATVRERYRTNPSEIIPSPHRLAVAQLLVQNSKLLSVDPWEITRRRAMDYLSVLEHVAQIISEQFPDVEIKVLYVCKPNQVPKLSPVAIRDANFGVVTVCRTPESDTLRNTLTSKWNGVITVVEDTAILDASLDIVTSRKVRDKMKSGQSVEQLVGEKINEYVQIHKLGQKMNGTEKWEQQEKILPNIASRPAPPALTSQYNKSISAQNSVISTSSSVLGSVGASSMEYSPDRLVPINELSTMNMQNMAYVPSSRVTKNSFSSGANSGINSGINSGVSSASSTGVYTPSWADSDV